ncbi:MAG: hypothetical protein J6B87_07745 [Clostridia bacterium]|nr:hypothetical protein [Clostridia bacterium]
MIIEIKRKGEYWEVLVNGEFKQSADTRREAEEDVQELIKEESLEEVETRIIK